MRVLSISVDLRRNWASKTSLHQNRQEPAKIDTSRTRYETARARGAVAACLLSPALLVDSCRLSSDIELSRPAAVEQTGIDTNRQIAQGDEI
jgi:hypothetical protein